MSHGFRRKQTGKFGHSSQPQSNLWVNHTCLILEVVFWQKHVLLVLVKTIPDTLNRGKETQMAIQWSFSIFLARLDKAREGERGWQACHRCDSFVCTQDSYIRSLHFVGVKWGWQAHMTPAVRGICTFAFFDRFVASLLFMKGTSCCVIKRN